MANFDYSGIQVMPQRLAIKAELTAQLPNVEQVDDGVIDEQNLLRDSEGRLVPYIVLHWGTPRRNPNGRSAGGVRTDDYYSVVDIAVVAPTSTQAGLLLDAVNDVILGFVPNGVGAEMAIEGLPDNFAVLNNQAMPMAYAISERFRFGLFGSREHMTQA